MSVRSPWVLVVGGAWLGLAGCGLFDDPSPEEATVLVEGVQDQQVRVVVSTRFISARSRTAPGTVEVELVDSDTVVTSLPFQATYDIEEDQRFFVEVARPDTVAEPDVTVTVYLDQEEEFNRSGRLVDVPIRFVFLFNQGTVDRVEVL